jgi:hypothetical protein
MFEEAAATIDDTTDLANQIGMQNIRQLGNNKKRAESTLLMA